MRKMSFRKIFGFSAVLLAGLWVAGLGWALVAVGGSCGSIPLRGRPGLVAYSGCGPPGECQPRSLLYSKSLEAFEFVSGHSSGEVLFDIGLHKYIQNHSKTFNTLTLSAVPMLLSKPPMRSNRHCITEDQSINGQALLSSCSRAWPCSRE
jgi:hypothetical protein